LINNYIKNFSGCGVSKTCDSLEPGEEYKYRICVIDSQSIKSGFSTVLTVRTESNFLFIIFILVFFFSVDLWVFLDTFELILVF